MLLGTTCPVCGRREGAPCRSCAEGLLPAPDLPAPAGLDACLALLAYETEGRALVSRLKYRNHRAALPGLAAAMASLVPPGSVDVVTWAPTTADRRRRRGFDHAELLARAVARQLPRPARRLLVRDAGAPQTGRTLAERREGPRLRPRVRLPGGRILLVDDVVTSGTTMSAGARALRSAGAGSVVGLAAARTPPPDDRADDWSPGGEMSPA